MLYGAKCAQQLSYGFNILEKLESCPQENQNLYGGMDFSKTVSKLSISSNSLDPKFEIFILSTYLDFKENCQPKKKA